MSSNRRTRTGRSLASVALIAGGIALLFWGKLRLVTQVPRAAYAEPETAPSAKEPPRVGEQQPSPDPTRDSSGAQEAADEPPSASPESGA